eukprot:TRINITY_DN28305_c0_g1_i1.p1 TRINITY_DN28305_c0_g1~~TRINITY_DN28305_c0_g1_i1.p1  ORF type:complete len:393 (-),score=64.10 TRINITY_DN28305_c0_g1_i1:182-1339(-)
MAPAREILGVVLITCGVQCSVMANTVVKLLAGVPMLQIMQARFLLQWTCSVSLCGGLKMTGNELCLLGPPGCRLYLLVRAMTYTGALMALWCALRYMPVGEATAIVYLHPVVCGLLAHVLLKEPLGRVFWIQATISCIGVALVANICGATQGASDAAGQSGFIGKGLALLACMCFAAGNCVVRLMPRCHPLEVQVFTDSAVALVAMPAALQLSGQAMDLGIWTGSPAILLAIFTIFGLSTSFLAITGFKLAPASIAALFMYLEVPSSFLVQVFFFGQVPSPAAVLGAALITLAALARLTYEARRAREDSIDLDMKGLETPNSLDLNAEVGQAMSRQGTLEACLGPCILAHKASEGRFLRHMTDDPIREGLLSPLWSPLRDRLTTV